MSDDTQRRSDHQEGPQRADQRRDRPADPASEEPRNTPPQWVRVLNLLLLAFVIFYAVQWVSQSGSREISYNAFKERVTSGQVAEVTIEGHQVRGAMKSE